MDNKKIAKELVEIAKLLAAGSGSGLLRSFDRIDVRTNAEQVGRLLKSVKKKVESITDERGITARLDEAIQRSENTVAEMKVMQDLFHKLYKMLK